MYYVKHLVGTWHIVLAGETRPICAVRLPRKGTNWTDVQETYPTTGYMCPMCERAMKRLRKGEVVAGRVLMRKSEL